LIDLRNEITFRLKVSASSIKETMSLAQKENQSSIRNEFFQHSRILRRDQRIIIPGQGQCWQCATVEAIYGIMF